MWVTDRARGSRHTTRLGKPGIWPGLYRYGRAGEIVFYVPGVTPACYRCVCSDRYTHAAESSVDVPSSGATIFDLQLVDSIAGQLVLGILTRGSDNRMGKLIEAFGNRNLLQVKIDPDYRLGGKDVFRRYLGDHEANVSFTTIALPMDPEPGCPDCGGLKSMSLNERGPGCIS